MKFILCDAYGRPIEEFAPAMILWSAQVILRGEDVWVCRRNSAGVSIETDGPKFFDKIPPEQIAKIRHDDVTAVQD